MEPIKKCFATKSEMAPLGGVILFIAARRIPRGGADFVHYRVPGSPSNCGWMIPGTYIGD